MKSFLLTLLAVLVGATLVLFAYDHFLVRPREAALLERMSAPPDLARLRAEAQEIAADAEASVQRSVEGARAAMDAQATETERRSLAQEAVQRASLFRVALSEYYMNWGRWPDSATDAGLPEAADSGGGGAQAIVLGEQGKVTVVMDPRFGDDSSVELTPVVNESVGNIEWKCVVRGDPVLKRALTHCEAGT